MKLRITQETYRQQCPQCHGTGKVPVPRTVTTRTEIQGVAADVPGEGSPMPCPTCNGKKFVLHAGDDS